MSSEESPDAARAVLRALLHGLLGSQEHEQSTTHTMAFFDPSTGRVTISQGHQNLDGLEKAGTLPASKASIAAMPRKLAAEEDKCRECAICLEGFEVGCEVREMPCKHWFHSGCVEKWLAINGSCPVCRFAMPVEEQGNGAGEEGERRGGDRMVLFTLVIGGYRGGSGASSETTDGLSGEDDIEL